LIFFSKKMRKKSEKSDDKKQIRNRGLMLENGLVGRGLSAPAAGAAPAPPKNLTTPHLSRARPLSGVTEILGGCGGGRPAAFSGARTPGLALKNKLFCKQSRARFSLKFSLKNEQKAPVILLKK
jgi:hypothetical protein